MNLSTAYTNLKKLENTIKLLGLEPEVGLHMNWVGDELGLRIRASEEYDPNGFWAREKSFVGTIDEAEVLFARAEAWIEEIPNAERRAIELSIQKLNEMADKLPKNSRNELVTLAMEGIKNMLLSKARLLAESGLPSPNSVTDLNPNPKEASNA